MRSSAGSGAALALLLLAGATLSAHRRDEYLQAARIAIEPGQVGIELDLTPGIAVAEQVLAAIDSDANGTISATEAATYRALVLREIAMDVDGTALSLAVVDTSFPEVAAVINGDGTLRVRLSAALPRLSAGVHRLRYRNGHRADIGAYLVNALVPASDKITVTAQRRDTTQRDVTIEYTLQPDTSTRLLGGLAVSVTGAMIWLLVSLWRRGRHP